MLVPLNSSSLQTLSDKTVLEILKTTMYVLTDTNFSFEAFIAKIEPMIEQDASNVALAQTSFILVS